MDSLRSAVSVGSVASLQRKSVMLRYLGPGQLLFAIGLAGLGTLSLLHHDFALQWQPVPAGVPAREALALASGAVLVLGAAALLLRRTARSAALVLALFLLSWVLLLQLPRLAMSPLDISVWLGLCESLTLTVGAWVLYAWADHLAPAGAIGFATTASAVGYARLVLGAAMVVFGLSHFAYASFTASMIPPFIPAPLALAYLTGAAHVAAGTALLLGIVPALAVRLEAVMLCAFVVLVHIPAVAGRPTSGEQWTALFIAMALAGAVWTVSGSFNVRFASATTREPLRS
jgi:uncharacterized membrane protein